MCVCVCELGIYQTFIINLICEYIGKVATYRLQVKTRPKVFGERGIRDGKFREVTARAATAAGSQYILCSSLCIYFVGFTH